MNSVSLEEKIAQMLLIELQGKQVTDELIEIIKKYKIGGVVVYRENYDTYDELLNFVNSIKRLNRDNEVPIFISVDQEGGRVNRMPKEIKVIRNATLMASTNDLEVVRKSSRLTSELLVGMGMNLNYAPVLDIRRSDDENHMLGNRCYGRNKEDVSKYGIEFMKQMQENGVIPVVKHFPGHGATNTNSHFILPVITKKKEELENDDMIPFKNAIEQGTDSVMVGHIIIKDIDRKYPASLSKKIIQNYLIEKYNFKGLIVTDDLKMWAIRFKYSRKKATKLAINAGNDMVILGCPYKKIIKLINDIAGEVRKGNIDKNRIEDSYNKIVTIKRKYNLNDNDAPGLDIEIINKEIEELNNRAVQETNIEYYKNN